MDVAFNKVATGSGRRDFVPANLTPEQNQAIVFQLSAESSSQMVLRNQEISTLEMKEPPGVFRTGHLNILRTSGESLKIGIGKKKEYEYILGLLQSFSPQAIRKIWSRSGNNYRWLITRKTRFSPAKCPLHNTVPYAE